MPDWCDTELGRVCTFRAGTAFPTDYQGGGTGDYPFIKVSDLSIPGNELFIRSSNNWISSDIAKQLKAKPVGAGSIVFAKIGEGLKAERLRLTAMPTLLDNNLMAAIPGNALDPRFALYLFATVGLSSWAAGSALPYLRQGDLTRIPIRLPELNEQRRIAHVLGAIDDLIETNTRAIRSIETLLQAHFEVLSFDSPGGAKLIDRVELNPRYPRPTGVAPYVDMAALPTESFFIENVSSRPAAGGARFMRDDVLLARITPCLENGKIAFAGNLVPGEVHVGSTEFIVMRSRDGVPAAWPYFLARSERFREFAIRHMTGSSGRQRLAAAALENYEVGGGSDALLAFEHLSTDMLDGARGLSRENQTLRRARTELLPLLMSGALRVRVEEVAT